MRGGLRILCHSPLFLFMGAQEDTAARLLTAQAERILQRPRRMSSYASEFAGGAKSSCCNPVQRDGTAVGRAGSMREGARMLCDAHATVFMT